MCKSQGPYSLEPALLLLSSSAQHTYTHTPYRRNHRFGKTWTAENLLPLRFLESFSSLLLHKQDPPTCPGGKTSLMSVSKFPERWPWFWSHRAKLFSPARPRDAAGESGCPRGAGDLPLLLPLLLIYDPVVRLCWVCGSRAWSQLCQSLLEVPRSVSGASFEEGPWQTRWCACSQNTRCPETTGKWSRNNTVVVTTIVWGFYRHFHTWSSFSTNLSYLHTF